MYAIRSYYEVEDDLLAVVDRLPHLGEDRLQPLPCYFADPGMLGQRVLLQQQVTPLDIKLISYNFV